MLRIRTITTTAAILIGIAGAIATVPDSIAPLRPVNSFYSIGIGKASMLDSYLSQLTYHGLDLRIGYERQQAMRFNPESWTQHLDLGLEYSKTDNPARNRSAHTLMVSARWGIAHRWRLPVEGLTLSVGPATSFDGGARYNRYNSNNPVSAQIRWSIDAIGQAVYNTRIGRLPITLRYRMAMPIIGCFFAPEYDESYYEIYLGNRRNIAHFASWGNRFDMVNEVSADLHFGNTVMRLGYRNVIANYDVSNLRSRHYINLFTIGLGGDWLSAGKGRRPDAAAPIISALY